MKAAAFNNHSFALTCGLTKDATRACPPIVRDPTDNGSELAIAPYLRAGDDAIVVRGVTLDVLLALADAKLGSRKAVMKTLSVSRQRLYSAAHGGPPLRAERLIRLSLVTGVDVGEALRAGGQHRLADLLDEAYEFRLGDTTPTQRALLRTFARLPSGTQQLFSQFMEGLADQQDA